MKTTSILFVASCFAGCGGSAASSSSGQLSLAVSNANWNWTSGGAAEPGDRWLEATAILSNHGEAAPLSEDSDYYSVETNTGVEVTALFVEPSHLPGECDGTNAVAAGGMDSCSLVFEFPVGATPTKLVYRDTAGRSSSAAIEGLAAPSPPACLAKLAAVPLVGESSGSNALLTCVTCAIDAGCMQPNGECNAPASCGGARFCSAQCPPTPNCDQQASTYLDCVAKHCETECS
jgi:hypothetical protein